MLDHSPSDLGEGGRGCVHLSARWSQWLHVWQALWTWMRPRAVSWDPVEDGGENLDSLTWMVGTGGQQLDSPALHDLGSQCDIPPRPTSAKPPSGEDPAAPTPGLWHQKPPQVSPGGKISGVHGQLPVRDVSLVGARTGECGRHAGALWPPTHPLSGRTRASDGHC